MGADVLETGLDYFGARYYSGAQGRFTTPDWSAKPQPIPYAVLARGSFGDGAVSVTGYLVAILARTAAPLSGTLHADLGRR